MRKIYLLIPAILLTTVSSAQSWQWGKRGGGNNSINDATSTERVKKIVTDSQGNVYALCSVAATNLDIDGNPKTGYSTTNNSVDYAIVSFSCDGSYRWSKIIGGPNTEYVNGLAVDGQDNVYVAGRIIPTETGANPIHFDTDFVLPQSAFSDTTYKRGLFIIKYNSSGDFQWISWPQADNIPITDTTQSYSLDFSLDANGNSYWFVRLRAGLYGGSYDVPVADAFHVLKYDANGNFTGGFPVSIAANENSLYDIKMAVNHQTQTIYFTGFIIPIFGGAISFNGQVVTHDMYLAAYDGTGQFLWMKQSTQTQNTGYGFQDIFINEIGDMYLTGGTRNGMGFGTHTFASTNGSTYPFILKLNENGDVIWGTNATTTAQGFSFGITEGATTGTFAGTTTWGGYSINTPPNTAYDVYMTRFNPQTGEILALETLLDDDGYDDAGTAITKDLHGNFYVGGRFAHLLYVNDDTLTNDGQQTDFFIAKFGSDDCTLGIKGNTKTGLNVYPNPAHDRLTVTGQSAKDYAIFNALGQSVMRGIVDGNEGVDVSRLAGGMYLLRVGDDAVLRFVKE